MTQLRTMMLEELQRPNFSQTTVRTYLKIVEDFSRHFHRPPDQLVRTTFVRIRCTCSRSGN